MNPFNQNAWTGYGQSFGDPFNNQGGHFGMANTNQFGQFGPPNANQHGQQQIRNRYAPQQHREYNQQNRRGNDRGQFRQQRGWDDGGTRRKGQGQRQRDKGRRQQRQNQGRNFGRNRNFQKGAQNGTYQKRGEFGANGGGNRQWKKEEFGRNGRNWNAFGENSQQDEYSRLYTLWNRIQNMLTREERNKVFQLCKETENYKVENKIQQAINVLQATGHELIMEAGKAMGFETRVLPQFNRAMSMDPVYNAKQPETEGTKSNPIGIEESTQQTPATTTMDGKQTEGQKEAQEMEELNKLFENEANDENKDERKEQNEEKEEKEQRQQMTMFTNDNPFGMPSPGRQTTPPIFSTNSWDFGDPGSMYDAHLYNQLANPFAIHEVQQILNPHARVQYEGYGCQPSPDEYSRAINAEAMRQREEVSIMTRKMSGTNFTKGDWRERDKPQGGQMRMPMMKNPPKPIMRLVGKNGQFAPMKREENPH